MTWEPAEKVQKNAAGEYRAMIGGEWVPVAKAQKSASGAYRIDRGGAVEQPVQPSTSTNGGMQSGAMQSGAMTALQGAGLGFMDELAGVGGAIAGKAFNLAGIGDNKTFAEDYRTIRDRYRGDVDGFAKANPKTALGLSIAGSLPTAIASRPLAAVKAAGAIPAAINATRIGAGYGAASGLGASTSETLGGMAGDTAKGAVIGGVLSGIVQPIGTAMGAIGSNIAQRFSKTAAADAAKYKLAESLQRDVRGVADPYLQAQTRMSKLGKESTIADAAGENTRALLDTLATLPGKAKDQIANLIHQRQATRAGRMIGAADIALVTQGKNAGQYTKALIEQRSKEAAPLYDAVRNAPVMVDDEIAGLLQATKPFHGEAERLATMKGTPLNLEKVQVGDQIPLTHLDLLKQTLFDVADAAKRGGNKQLGAAADSLRVRLTGKLDMASPKNQAGESIYKAARDTFAGHSETIGAVEAGKKALFESADAIKDMTSGMGQSEIEAFRVGALQSLRDKLGSEAGQTQMMKMWKEPKTSERIQQIFGGDYRKFAADVAREARLKRLEGVGKGSQTASRQYAAGDLDKMPIGEVGQAVANAKAGNLFGLASAAGDAWNRVKMPESTRNSLAELMMEKGAKGQYQLNSLQDFMNRRLNKTATARGSIAAELGYQANRGENQ